MGIVNFSFLNLQVGDLLQMQLSTDLNNQRHSVWLIGYREKQSILITAPKFNHQVPLLRAQQNIVVRCFSGRNAYAFTASILHVCHSPYPYLHVSYPVSVQEIEIRKSARVKAN